MGYERTGSDIYSAKRPLVRWGVGSHLTVVLDLVPDVYRKIQRHLRKKYLQENCSNHKEGIGSGL